MAHPARILEQLEATPRKAFSQNFLTSPHWAEKLSQLALEPQSEYVWEIGSGLGALTAHLAKGKHRLRLFELDRKFVQYLKEQFPSVEIVEGDFLNFDFTQESIPNRSISLISNLPYHMSSPIFFRLLDVRHLFSQIVLTFQKEFAERLIAPIRGSSFSALSVIAQTHFEIKRIGTLAATAFYPAPDIDSVALHLTPIWLVEEEARFRQFVKLTFSSRRKKMISNLRTHFSLQRLKETYAQLNWSEKVRAEEISPKQYIELFKTVVLGN